MGSARHSDTQGLIDVIPGRRADRFQLLFYVFQVFHFEADVVDATNPADIKTGTEVILDLVEVDSESPTPTFRPA